MSPTTYWGIAVIVLVTAIPQFHLASIQQHHQHGFPKAPLAEAIGVTIVIVLMGVLWPLTLCYYIYFYTRKLVS